MIILASNSPRRKEILGIILKEFEVIAPNIDESFDENIPPVKNCENVAFKKAEAVAAGHPNDIVIGADSIVLAGQTVLGKPQSEDEAASMLRLLSGQRHQVVTGVAIIKGTNVKVFSETTEVFFRNIDSLIDGYVKSGEPMDKAGAYGIQGFGAVFAKKINGDFFNVMGLPLSKLYKELADFL